MIRKIIMGGLWFVFLYYAACIVVGALAGAIAGADDPRHATEAGRMAAAAIVATYQSFILGGALCVAVIGSAMGFLPWTKGKKPAS